MKHLLTCVEGHGPTIAFFDLSRVRPGLRAHLARARAIVVAAREAGEWPDRAGMPGSEDILDILPPRGGLYQMDDHGAARAAIEASLLALWSIQSGSWSATHFLPFFMQLQAEGQRILDRIGEGSAAAQRALG